MTMHSDGTTPSTKDRIIKIGNRLAGVAAVVLLATQSCQTSFTPPPNCPPGQHAVRAPSHQGKVWECVRN